MSLKVPNLVRGCLDPISSHGCTLSTSLCSTCPEKQLWIRTCSTWRTNPCATALSSLRLQHRTRTCSPWQWPNDPNHSFPRVQSLCSYFESSVATSQWIPAQLAGQAFLSLVHPSHILRQFHTLRFCQTTAGLETHWRSSWFIVQLFTVTKYLAYKIFPE